MVLGAREVVELFHLRFAHAFFGGLPDKSLAAIKGGINLRFFFNSVRFSEDLDLDIMTMAKATLENRVDRLMTSPALLAPLKARGVLIDDVTKPKQTETVQRWKIALKLAGQDALEHTKIEFSRRDDVSSAELDKVDEELTRMYGATTVLATHYKIDDAVRQKIRALAGRSQTQPRDVFDLDLLFSKPDVPVELEKEDRDLIESAIENASKLEYDDYAALVVTYLEPQHAETYRSRETWEAMQLGVIERLEALR